MILCLYDKFHLNQKLTPYKEICYDKSLDDLYFFAIKKLALYGNLFSELRQII